MAEVLRGQKLGALVRKVESLMKTPILIRKGVIIQLTGAIVQGHSLRYKLHNAKLFGWKTSDHADEDPIWETDGLIRESESLKFFHKRQFITSWREEQMDNRLLAFE
jgi:hypothetical protein